MTVEFNMQTMDRLALRIVDADGDEVEIKQLVDDVVESVNEMESPDENGPNEFILAQMIGDRLPGKKADLNSLFFGMILMTMVSARNLSLEVVREPFSLEHIPELEKELGSILEEKKKEAEVTQERMQQEMLASIEYVKANLEAKDNENSGPVLTVGENGVRLSGEGYHEDP